MRLHSDLVGKEPWQIKSGFSHRTAGILPEQLTTASQEASTGIFAPPRDSTNRLALE